MEVPNSLIPSFAQEPGEHEMHSHCADNFNELEECSIVSSFDTENDAWSFVEGVHKLCRDLAAFFPHAEVFPVAVDDLVHFIVRMLEEQWRFIGDGKPALVDVGYHYTDAENIPSIATRGLLTSRDRNTTGIRSQSFNGSMYGDAIYTGNNPFAFSASYGSLGLIVARLKGRQAYYDGTGPNEGVDTYYGDPGHAQKVALRRSSLCVPLIRFNAKLVDMKHDDSFGNIILYFYHVWLQKLIDDFFHGGVSTEVNFPLASQVVEEIRGTYLNRPRQTCHDNARLSTLAHPLSTHFPGLQTAAAIQYILYLAPERLQENVNFYDVVPAELVGTTCQGQPCSLCHLPMVENSGDVARLSKCQHKFHLSCLQSLGDSTMRCPLCFTSLVDPQGTSPPASMTIYEAKDLVCDGYPMGSFCIRYHVPSGVQQSYHPKPGQLHNAAEFIAFIPNTIDGEKILARLKHAFLRGLTLCVSSTSNIFCTEEVTWSQIPHKTRPSGGGPNGYPDADYLTRCNNALNELGVPAEP